MTHPSLCLFLCTGNYYRSRFAEEFFNHLAQQRALGWRAFSRALFPRLAESGNVGPISAFTLAALQRRGVEPRAADRFPATVNGDDWQRAHRVIAACDREHRPMVERDHPAWAATVEYWDVEDLDRCAPETAIAALDERVHALIQTLSPRPANTAACCPVCGAALVQVRCKSVCQSATCVNRIVYSCCEF